MNYDIFMTHYNAFSPQSKNLANNKFYLFPKIGELSLASLTKDLTRKK